MPRQPINYDNLIIYKIVCNNITVKNCYVGSTTHFTKRKSQHKSACNNPNDKLHSLLLYTTIRANGGWDNWSMIEIIKQPCVDSNAARRLERDYVELLEADLNMYLPIVSKEEVVEYKVEYNVVYRETHKAEIAEQKAAYRETHKAKIAEYNAEYYKANKAELAEQNAEYYQANKSKLVKQVAAYRETHKDIINANRRAKRALQKL